MNILVVGDVIGQAGVKFIRDKLSGIKALWRKLLRYKRGKLRQRQWN